MISYALGLAMANIAVYMMKMGQPALLYLVPMCLGTVSILGYIRGELKLFWIGPPILKRATTIVCTVQRAIHAAQFHQQQRQQQQQQRRREEEEQEEHQR